MERRLLSGLMLTFLSLSMLALVFDVRPVRGMISTILIRSNGEVVPATAPIQRNGSLYKLTDDITSESSGIYIERDNVILDGEDHVLEGNGGSIGIEIWGRSNITIRNTIIRDFWYGIESGYSTGNYILGNSIETLGGSGIELFDSSNNIIVGNRITGCSGHGVLVDYFSDNNSVLGNNVTNNFHGLSVLESRSNRISGNKVEANSFEGILLGESPDNIITGNKIAQNNEGVSLYTSSNNVIAGNNITGNYLGAYLSLSSSNSLYHNNFVNNSLQAFAYDTANVWDDGYPSGGNYWSNYRGIDSNNDGIGDSPYAVDSQNVDRYPSMNQRPLAAHMYLEPSTATLDVGSTFSVNIMVSWVQNLWAWQAGIRWDPTMLKYVSFSGGEFQQLAGLITASAPEIDEPAGKTPKPALESTIRGGKAPINGVSLRLLTITFKVINAGTSQLELTEPSLIAQDPFSTTAYARWSDINGDGQVDAEDVDFATVTLKKGRYNQSVDLDDDGKVDLTDLSIVTSDFGKTETDINWGVTNTVNAVPVIVTGSQVYARPSSFYITSVPYHAQLNSYYCGPAALEMLFDFYGPDVSQLEIGDVARTAPAGTYTVDMPRAAHFSNMSTSVGRASPLNYTGYSTRKLGYAAFEAYSMTFDDLKSLIVAGYPIIVLTTWHFRVAVGYDSQYITFQDSYYGSMYNMTYQSFDIDWDYSGHWGLFVSPWKIEISNARNVIPGDIFQVAASITYPWEPPFQKGMYPAVMTNATITLPDGLALISGETATKSIGFGFMQPGDTINVTWTVQAQRLGNYKLSVEGAGRISGFVPWIPSGYPQYFYDDRIGGTSESIVTVTSTPDSAPPATIDNYDDLWHNQNFKINLTAQDNNSGAMETLYRINNGPKKTLSVDGQPTITLERANNTLEYWSMDWAGNEESPHNILSNIKLDKTNPILGTPSRMPSSDVQKNQEVKVSVSAADSLSGVKNVTLYYALDDAVSWQSLIMNYNASTNLYETAIPGQPAGMLVKFKVVVCDMAGNTAVKDNFSTLYTYQLPPAQATVDLDVDILNLAAKDGLITGHIELLAEYNLSDIETFTIRLNGTVPVDLRAPFEVGDHDSDGIPDFTVQFNRTAVSEFIVSSKRMTGNITLTVTGRLSDRTVFEGSHTIVVRMRGDVNIDGKVDIRDISLAALSFGTYLGQAKWNPIADENEDNQIDIRDLVLVAQSFGKIYI